MESSFRKIVGHIYDAGLLKSPELAQMDDIIAMVIQLRDSVVPELLILVLIAIHTSVSFRNVVGDSSWLAYPVGNSYHLTLAGWYAVLVSGTIFQFLLGLNLWKWLLWTMFAFKVSRLNLQLVATHPDGNGGLGFLGMTPLAFTPISFATAAVIAATFRNQILHKGAHLASFAIPAIVLVVLVAVVALGPLVFFVPRLAAVRRKGILEYAILGQMQSTEFHEKWILNRAGREDELIDAAEISTLCDYGQAYDRIENMKPFPTDRSALVGAGSFSSHSRVAGGCCGDSPDRHLEAVARGVEVNRPEMDPACFVRASDGLSVKYRFRISRTKSSQQTTTAPGSSSHGAVNPPVIM